MFRFLKPKEGPDVEAGKLVQDLVRQANRPGTHPAQASAARSQIMNASKPIQRAVALGLVGWLNANSDCLDPQGAWINRSQNINAVFYVYRILGDLLNVKLSFTEAELLVLLNWSASQKYNSLRSVPQMIKICTDFLKENPLSNDLRCSIQGLIHSISKGQENVGSRRWILRLSELLGEDEPQMPLNDGDIWAQAALQEIQALPKEKQLAWAYLLVQCLRVSGSVPGEKWLKGTDRYLQVIGQAEFLSALLRWFPLVDRPRQVPLNQYDPLQTLLPVNANILKGLVWQCSRSDSLEMVRALSSLAISTYRKIPGLGPRASKVGNACFWSLSKMECSQGISQLSILKVRIKGSAAQKVIANSLEIAARRMGLTPNEIEELSVPTYGLEEVGLARMVFDDVICEIRVNGTEVTQTWCRGDKPLASVPKTVKEQIPDELKEISQTVKDIRRMLPAQRDRIENVYLNQQTWKLPVWQERYLDHPLVGTITRRLIWKFTRRDQAASGIWLDGRMVGRDDVPLDWLDDETMVELWHPLHVDPEVVVAWRDWLMRHEVRQPFKQAHREVYILTEAERETATYSNRYAAHILRQHQFNALCSACGWKNTLRLMVDAEFPPASKLLPAYGLRAEYWVEGIGTNYGTDTNDTGTYLFLTTDQVRFYRIHSAENRAHASGGGYTAVRRNDNADIEPLSLDQIPPLVFSEIFRDVDMFVGVASVGNDPTWLDRGGEVRFRDYWHNFSFGELGESAKTRKQLLEILLPRLKIADRCKLTDKFLVVRGNLRTYKIHLGSSNILMEPNDQYLCIVPSRSIQTNTDKLFLPFEGDQVLAVILSKAFLLANDKKITDPTITRQIKLWFQ